MAPLFIAHFCAVTTNALRDPRVTKCDRTWRRKLDRHSQRVEPREQQSERCAGSKQRTFNKFAEAHGSLRRVLNKCATGAESSGLYWDRLVHRLPRLLGFDQEIDGAPGFLNKINARRQFGQFRAALPRGHDH